MTSILWYAFFVFIIPSKIPSLIRDADDKVTGFTYGFNPLTRLLIERTPGWGRWIWNQFSNKKEKGDDGEEGDLRG